VFFMFEPSYRLFMYFDLVFLIPEAGLLTLAVRGEVPASKATAMSAV
jgi:hypothetical protein